MKRKSISDNQSVQNISD